MADPALVVARVTARRALRSGLGWGVVFAVALGSTASAYTSSFPTPESRRSLATSYEHNRGLAAILGEAHGVDTVSGFTAWRLTVIISVVGAVWGLLLATRLLRGEEDAGRWELLLAGATTRGRAAAQALGGLVAGWVVLWSLSMGATVASGRRGDVGFPVTAAAFMGTVACTSALVFLAVGAAVSQLAVSRRQANVLGAAVIGAAYLLRMAADSAPGLSALRWLSPIGWAEEMRPLTGSRPWVLVLPALTVAGLAVLTVRLAARRDLGAGALPSDDVAEPRTGLLGGVTGLAARLGRGTAVGWLGGLALAGLVFGLVADAAAEGMRGSTAIEDAIIRAGGRSFGAKAYLGLTFLMVATLLAVAAATQVSALRADEEDGRLDNLLVRPVSRARWFLGRIALAALGILLVSAVTGLAAWVGAASQDTGVGLAELVEAGLNMAAPALFVLGVGALLFGLRPRWAVSAAYAVVVWSFLVEMIGVVVVTDERFLDTSLLHHVTPAPAASPDWGSASWLAALAAAGVLGGLAAFSRRDLAGA